MRLAGMKRSTRVFGDRVLRSRKRSSVTCYEHESKHMKLLPVDVLDNQEISFKLWEDNLWFNRRRKVVNLNMNGIDEIMGKFDKEERVNAVMGINGKEREEINGEFKKVSLVDDNNNDCVIASRVKGFDIVFTRKRKRSVQTGLSVKSSGLDENRGLDKKFGKKYCRKEVRTSLKSGSDGKAVVWKGPILFAGERSFTHVDSGNSSCSVYGFSCFVSSVLRYMRKVKVFSWRKFALFLLLEPDASVYQSIGLRLLLDSTCTKSNGYFKAFGSIHSIPFFTVNFSSLPSWFLYMHSNILLKSAFVSYAFLLLSIDENGTNDDIEVPSIDTTKRDNPLDKCVVVKKVRSASKRVPRVIKDRNNSSQREDQTHVDSIVQLNDSSQRKRALKVSKDRTDPSQRKDRADVENIVPVHDSSQRKRDPKVSKDISDSSQRKDLAHVENIVPVNSSSQRKRAARVLKDRNDSSQRKGRAHVENIVRPANDSSQRKRAPRVSKDRNDSSQRKDRAHVEYIIRPVKDIFAGIGWGMVDEKVPVPVLKEVEGYAEEEYVPFILPESYISLKNAELTRTLEKDYPIYDLDSDDEQWLRKFNNEGFGVVSEDTFEKVIHAFEKGIYCSPDDNSNAASAIDRCLDFASKEVLEGVYGYWETKRNKKLASLVSSNVFQGTDPKSDKNSTTDIVHRKTRSDSRRTSQRSAEKQVDLKKAMLNDEAARRSEEAARVQEAQEAARRSEEAASVKRNVAQELMEAADLAAYRAYMALRIADALASGSSVDQTHFCR